MANLLLTTINIKRLLSFRSTVQLNKKLMTKDYQKKIVDLEIKKCIDQKKKRKIFFKHLEWSNNKNITITCTNKIYTIFIVSHTSVKLGQDKTRILIVTLHGQCCIWGHSQYTSNTKINKWHVKHVNDWKASNKTGVFTNDLIGYLIKSLFSFNLEKNTIMN